MTQQPYGQPQYPAYPQQPQQQFPVQPQPAYPPQTYPQPVAPAYPQQGYPQGAPQQAPAQPLASGSLDEFYSQPSSSTGPSLSFKDKPVGTEYVGVVARDVTNADIQQMTDFNTKAPLFYRDGRPKFAMKVPLRVQPSQEHPEGEASWYVKGQARDELVRAMAEAGVDGAPQAGATIVIRLAGKRSSGAGLNPANVFEVRYIPAGQQGQAPQPAQQPVQQVQPGAGAPSPAPAPQPVQQYAPPVQQAPVPQQAPQVPVHPQAPAPAPVQPTQGLQPPADLSPEQQQLFAQLTGAQQG